MSELTPTASATVAGFSRPLLLHRSVVTSARRPGDIGGGSRGERPNDTFRRDSLGHAHDTIHGYEGWRMVRPEIVECRALLASQLEQVRRALGRAQHHACAGALQQHVRHDGRPVDDGRNGQRGGRKPSERALDALALIARRAGDLAGDHRPVVSDRREIGERTSNVDADRESAHAAEREATG